MPSGGSRPGAGRKKLPQEMKAVSVYMTENELKMVDEGAEMKKMTRNDYLRSIIFREK